MERYCLCGLFKTDWRRSEWTHWRRGGSQWIGSPRVSTAGRIPRRSVRTLQSHHSGWNTLYHCHSPPSHSNPLDWSGDHGTGEKGAFHDILGHTHGPVGCWRWYRRWSMSSSLCRLYSSRGSHQILSVLVCLLSTSVVHWADSVHNPVSNDRR